mgnify:FL=1
MRFYVYEELVMNTEKIVKYMFYSLSAVIWSTLILTYSIIKLDIAYLLIGDIIEFIYKHCFVYISIFYMFILSMHFMYRYRKYKTMENINTYISARKTLVITSLIALDLNVFTFAFVVYAIYHPEASLPIPFDPNILFISCFISIIAWGISLVTVICSYFIVRRK